MYEFFLDGPQFDWTQKGNTGIKYVIKKEQYGVKNQLHKRV